MSDIIKQAQEIKEALNDPEQRQSYLKNVLSENNPRSGEQLTNLIHEIIKITYHEGLKQGHDQVSQIARNKVSVAADEQAEKISPIIKSLREKDITNFQQIAEELNQQGLYTRGGHPWTRTTVHLLIERIDKIEKQGKASLKQDYYADVIPTVLERHEAGETFAAIARELNENGYRTQLGSPYTSTSIRNMILRNRDKDVGYTSGRD